MNSLKFSLKPIAPNTVEVQSHDMRYVCEIQRSLMRLRAYRSKELLEQADYEVDREKRVVVLKLKDERKHSLSMKLAAVKGGLSSELVVNKKRVKVTSADEVKHAFELARLSQDLRVTEFRYLRWFMKDLRNDAAFRQEMQSNTGLGELSETNGEIVLVGFCAIACMCCGFLSPTLPVPGVDVPDLLCCTTCLFCFKIIS